MAETEANIFGAKSALAVSELDDDKHLKHFYLLSSKDGKREARRSLQHASHFFSMACSRSQSQPPTAERFTSRAGCNCRQTSAALSFYHQCISYNMKYLLRRLTLVTRRQGRALRSEDVRANMQRHAASRAAIFRRSSILTRASSLQVEGSRADRSARSVRVASRDSLELFDL